MRLGTVCGFALQGDLILQAAIVGHDDRMAKAGTDGVIRLNDAMLQQPARPKQATELFVVGEMQLNRTLTPCHAGLESLNGKEIGGEVRLGYGCCPAVQTAIMDFCAIGWIGPTLS